MSVRARPFQRVKLSAMDISVGSQTNTSWISVGMPTIRDRTILSRLESRRTFPLLTPLARAPDGALDSGGTRSLAVVLMGIPCLLLRRVKRLGLGLEILDVHLAVLKEGLQGGDHDVVGHGGEGVAVKELADRFGVGNRVGAFLVQLTEFGRVRALGGGDVGGVHGGVRVLGLGSADEFHELAGRRGLAA